MNIFQDISLSWVHFLISQRTSTCTFHNNAEFQTSSSCLQSPCDTAISHLLMQKQVGHLETVLPPRQTHISSQFFTLKGHGYLKIPTSKSMPEAPILLAKDQENLSSKNWSILMDESKCKHTNPLFFRSLLFHQNKRMQEGNSTL